MEAYIDVTLKYLLPLIGALGTGFAIYQTAVVNQSKERKKEFQHILAGIYAEVNGKKSKWQAQLSLLGPPKTPEQLEIFRLHQHIVDDVGELTGLTTALEGAIDSESSAIEAQMEKVLRIVELGKKMQDKTQTKPVDINFDRQK